MSDSAFERFQKIFEQAVELPAEQRAAFLDQACADDADLRARIEELLAADAELEGFLEPPAGFGLPVDKLKKEAEGFLPEEEIGGYQLLRELGRGGRGVVYLARDPQTDAFVALKVLGMGMLPSAVAVERFRREAKAVARLSHPGIVRLVRAGEEPSRPYLVMEYIEGHTLADEILLQRHARDAVELPPHLLGCKPQLPTDEPSRYRAAVELVRAMADSLGHAHERGVLHRDIKPQNVLLDRQGQPHMVDFGLAFVEGEQELTRTGDIEGTPNYMSPEQVRAERDRIDLRTDVYSLGVVLYELLTLRRPFDAPTANQVMQNITRTMPPRIRRVAPSVPSELETLCTTAIEKRRRDRYASMASFRADLDAYLNSRPLQARRPGALTRSRRAIERRPMPYLAAGVAALALMLGLVLGEPIDRWQTARAFDRAIAEIGEFGPQSDLRPLLGVVEQIEARDWTLSQARSERVEGLLAAGLAAEQSEVDTLLDRAQIEGDLVLGLVVLKFSETGSAGPQAWFDARAELWGRWGLSNELQAQLLRELSHAGVILEAQSGEQALPVAIEFAPIFFPRTAVPEFSAGQARRFLPGFELRAQTTYLGRFALPDGRMAEFTVLPTGPGSTRRLIFQAQEYLDGLIDFAAFELPVPGEGEAATQKSELLGGSRSSAYSLASGYVSVGEYLRFAAATGAHFNSYLDYVPASLAPLINELPAFVVRSDMAAAYAAWRGCRLPWLGELLVGLGPFAEDGRPFSVEQSRFEESKRTALRFPARVEMTDPVAVAAFAREISTLLLDADAEGVFGAHPSGLTGWFHGLLEMTATRADPGMVPDVPGFADWTWLFAGVYGRDFEGQYKPVTVPHENPIGAAHWGATFRCARSVAALR
jgi:serine/threonine protein kinase